MMTPARGGLLVGTVASLATAALMLNVSGRLERAESERELRSIAERVLARSESVVREAIDALRALQSMPVSSICSSEAMDRFSKSLAQTHRLRGIGGIGADGRACVGTGGSKVSATLPEPAWRRGEYAVWLGAGELFDLPERTGILSLGHVFAAIDPFFLVDAVTHDDIHIALFSSETGVTIAATTGADVAQMRRIRPPGGIVESDRRLYVAIRAAAVPAVLVVSRGRTSALGHWREQGWIWFALALVFGAVGGFIAAAVLRHYQSPASALKRAIANRDLAVFYQPIVELDTGRCTGAEALVRWLRSDGTMVRPDLFIPLAEETGLVLALTDQVLENVVADLGTLLRERPLYVSVNLSARDVASTRVLELAQRLLGAASIPAERIAFEATERGFAEAASAREALRRYRGAGHRILIDDFGTGYSSLSQLQSFEVDAIKIDKSFVDAIGSDAATRSVVPHIIAMAKELGLELVAEGVETDVQSRYLRERGVQYGQGWLFGKPMPAGDFVRYVENQAGT